MTPSYLLSTLVESCFQNSIEIIGNRDISIEGVSDLSTATGSEISFFANDRYLAEAKKSKAAAIITTADAYKKYFTESCQSIYLLHENPTAAFQEILTFFKGTATPKITGFHGIHPTAVIHPTASISKDVVIGPYVVIDEFVEIGANTQILAHAYIGPTSKIGSDCTIHAHSVVRENCTIHDRVIIQPGAVIGSCGFGYATNKRGEHSKLEHWGSVVLENDVEIGANSTLDRGRFHATHIGRGTKIDNLVQIAHNVTVGSHCFLVSQVGIAGSAVIGNHVVLAGKVGVNGHIKICNQVIIAACSGVTKSVTEPGTYSGMPLLPVKEHNKTVIYARKTEEIFHQLSDRISKLELFIQTRI